MRRRLLATTAAIIAVIPLAALALNVGNPRTPAVRPVKPNMPSVEAYRASLRAASSEQEKWELTTAFLESGREAMIQAGLTPYSPDRYVQNMLSPCGYYAEIWLEDYPELVSRVKLNDAELRRVTCALDHNSPQSWDEERTDPKTGATIRVYTGSRRTYAENARDLLGRITGQLFQTRDEAEAWLNRSATRPAQ